MQKECTRCGEAKPLDLFNRDPHARDGHESRCKACRREQANEWARQNRGRMNGLIQKHNHSKQARLRDTATNHRQEWTEEELALAADRSLTAPQVAKALGRSLYAVHNARGKLKKKEA